MKGVHQFVLGSDSMPLPIGTRARPNLKTSIDTKRSLKRVKPQPADGGVEGPVVNKWQRCLEKIYGPRCALCNEQTPCAEHMPGIHGSEVWWHQLRQGVVLDRGLEEMTKASQQLETAKQSMPDSEWRKEWSAARTEQLILQGDGHLATPERVLFGR